MKVTLTDVRTMFEKVLTGEVTREAADRWAYSIIQESESGNLSYSPPEDEKKIWSGILYLYGIDSKDSPNNYLHTLDDIHKAMKQKL